MRFFDTLLHVMQCTDEHGDEREGACAWKGGLLPHVYTFASCRVTQDTNGRACGDAAT